MTTTTFRHVKNFLLDPPAQFDGIFKWDFMFDPIKSATGRNIKPMDIDAHVEIGGQHLLIEKKGEGTEVPDGQKEALKSYWSQGYSTVMFMWTRRENGREITCPVCSGRGRVVDHDQSPCLVEIHYPKCEKRVIVEPSSAEMHHLIFSWAKYAETRPSPFSYSAKDDAR